MHAKNERMNRKVLARVRENPELFARSVLGVKPWVKQVEILEAVRDARLVAVRSGQGVGKTFTMAVAALWFLYTRRPAKVVTTAPTRAQVVGQLWQEIHRLVRGARVALGGELLQDRLKLGANWYAQGRATDAPERFQGVHSPHLLMILDEAPGIAPEIWEAAESCVTGSGSRLVAIGNPTRADGPFHAAFTSRAQSWRRIHVSCLEHPNVKCAREVMPGAVTSEWIQERARSWGVQSPLYRARVLGEFPDTSEDALIPLGWLGVEASGGERGRRVMGVDVARFGGDKTAIVVRDEREVLHIEETSGEDTMSTTGRVIDMARRFDVAPERIMVDVIGIGAGVVDRLAEQGMGVAAVNFAAKASRGTLLNLRAECYWRLRQRLAPGEDRFAVSERFAGLVGELSSIRYGFTSAGRLKIEAKKEIRRRAGRSPDRADALALTFAGWDEARLWVLGIGE